MSDMSKLLESAEAQMSTHPISVNARDLFFKGHITAEEYQMLCKGETVAMSIRHTDKVSEGNPEHVQELTNKVSDAPHLDIASDTTVDYIDAVIRKAEKLVDAAAKEWMPEQINRTLIRTKQCPAGIKIDTLQPAIEVRFTLLDVEKETSRTVATAITIDTRLLVGDEEQDKLFWKKFEYQLHHKFSSIVLQLVKAIKSGNFGINQ